jgi:RNA polymerase sigma-70 factor, ECF subfamily
MSHTEPLAAEFQQHRTYLLGVAYRLTGSHADAEDAVQEAWLRLARQPSHEVAAIRNLRAWLTSVVGRLCIDRLRSAALSREHYVGTWLPEPLITTLDGPADPLDEVVRDESVRLALLVVLERLPPEQRVAFVLHDVYDVPFHEIANLLGCSHAAARQYASRARRTVTDVDPPSRVALQQQQALLEAFAAALATGDLQAIVELLHPDVVMLGDGGGRERTARRPVVGALKVARFYLGLQERYGAAALGIATPVLVNGDLGLIFQGSSGDERHPPFPRRVSSFAVRDGLIAAIYDMVNPDKLTRVPPLNGDGTLLQK